MAARNSGTVWAPLSTAGFALRDTRVAATMQVEGFREITVALREEREDQSNGATPSRTSLWPISRSQYVVRHSTRPCSHSRQACGSPQLKPDRNYGLLSNPLRQWSHRSALCSRRDRDFFGQPFMGLPNWKVQPNQAQCAR